MRILLITDTHGDIDIINQVIDREDADACIHCGDFGLYDHDSVDRLTKRELRLRLKHSHLPKKTRKLAWKLSPDELRQIIRDEGLLAGLAPYLDGKVGFKAPVYAVWGNHEDVEVVRRLRAGAARVENLFLLDEHAVHTPAPWLRLIGVGGNFYLNDSPDLFAPDLTGTGGQIRASFVQYARLMAREQAAVQAKADADTKAMAEARSQPHPKVKAEAKARAKDQAKTRPFTILVGHVSPGKARLLERMALVLGVDMSVCGHMNPPISHAYSLFTMCEPHEALARSEADFAALRDHFAAVADDMDTADRTLVEDAMASLDVAPFPTRERGSRAEPGSMEAGFYTTQFVNVGDMPDSYSVLDIDESGAVLSHRSQWLRPPHVLPSAID